MLGGIIHEYIDQCMIVVWQTERGLHHQSCFCLVLMDRRRGLRRFERQDATRNDVDLYRLKPEWRIAKQWECRP